MICLMVWYWIVELLNEGAYKELRYGVGGIEHFITAMLIFMLWVLGTTLVFIAARKERM